MRKVFVVTERRADFSRFKPILEIIDNDVNLSANQKEQVFSEPLIMEESEILKINVTSGAADIVVSILEINREDL